MRLRMRAEYDHLERAEVWAGRTVIAATLAAVFQTLALVARLLGR